MEIKIHDYETNEREGSKRRDSLIFSDDELNVDTLVEVYSERHDEDKGETRELVATVSRDDLSRVVAAFPEPTNL